jgi:hypothetical protein
MPTDWRSELNKILDGRTKATRAEIESARFAEFLASVALPALQELAAELGRHDRKASVRETSASATLTVLQNETEEISFRVLARSLPVGIVPYVEVRLRKGQRLVKTEGHLKKSVSSCTIGQIQGSDVIECFLAHYRSALDVG